MAETVTGFEESFQAHAKEVPTPREDYEKLYEALRLDLKVAENIFARATKRCLKQLLHDTPLILQESSESRDERPLWVAENSATLALEPTFQGSYADVLFKLIDSLVKSILSSYPAGSSVVLVDPVQTKIMPVGDLEFTFRVKQKWGYRKPNPNG